MLKENLPALKPFILLIGIWAKRFLISANNPVYVAGFDLGVLPIAD